MNAYIAERIAVTLALGFLVMLIVFGVAELADVAPDREPPLAPTVAPTIYQPMEYRP